MFRGYKKRYSDSNRRQLKNYQSIYLRICLSPSAASFVRQIIRNKIPDLYIMAIRILFFSALFSLLNGNLLAQRTYYKNKYFLKSEIKEESFTYAEVDYSNPIAIWEQELGISKITSHILDLALVKELDCDLYCPNDSIIRPAFILIHGGAFIPGIGSRKDRSIVGLSYEFAQRGYRVFSIEYRTMNILAPSFIKGGYMATQDAKAIIRYIANNSDHFFINPEEIFIGGISAGAVTAMNAVFLDQGENIANRSEKLDRMYGCLNCVGADSLKYYTLQGIVNIAGGIYDKEILDNNHIPIISFHGNNDDVVPMDYGIPFVKFSTKYNKFFDALILAFQNHPKIVNELKEGKIENIYGSRQIHNYLYSQNKSSKLIEVPGGTHYLVMSENNVFMQSGKEIIADISDFMYKVLSAKMGN